jgi:Rap1a immunity proteins
MPESVTVEQSVAVVVRWLDRNPQSRRENFTRIAMSALHEAWPCDE